MSWMDRAQVFVSSASIAQSELLLRQRRQQLETELLRFQQRAHARTRRDRKLLLSYDA